MPPASRLCHNYYQQNHDRSDSSVTNYFLNLGVEPLRKLALKVPVLNCDTACSRVVAYRQVPRKPRLACPVKCEAYLTRVRGEHHLRRKVYS